MIYPKSAQKYNMYANGILAVITCIDILVNDVVTVFTLNLEYIPASHLKSDVPLGKRCQFHNSVNDYAL